MTFSDILYAIGGIFVSSLGGGAIVFALSSWFGKVWANWILEKDRARYAEQLEGVRAKYQREVEGELQQLRDRLERGQFVHRLQFETEFKIYRELWEKLVEAKGAALQLRYIATPVNADTTPEQIDERNIQRYSKAEAAFRKCYISSEPFLDPQVHEVVKKLAHAIFDEGCSFADRTHTHAKDHWAETKKNAKLIEEHTEAICGAIRQRIGMMNVLPDGPPSIG